MTSIPKVRNIRCAVITQNRLVLMPTQLMISEDECFGYGEECEIKTEVSCT